MNYSEKAEKMYCDGCNCAQAVLAAFSDIDGISYDDAVRIAAAFGSGIAGTGNSTCGALSGMLMAYGAACGGELARPVLMKNSKMLIDEFISDNGSDNCSELRRLRKESGGKSCAGLVKSAAGILEKHIKSKEL